MAKEDNNERESEKSTEWSSSYMSALISTFASSVNHRGIWFVRSVTVCGFHTGGLTQTLWPNGVIHKTVGRLESLVNQQKRVTDCSDEYVLAHPSVTDVAEHTSLYSVYRPWLIWNQNLDISPAMTSKAASAAFSAEAAWDVEPSSHLEAWDTHPRPYRRVHQNQNILLGIIQIWIT